MRSFDVFRVYQLHTDNASQARSHGECFHHEVKNFTASQ